MNIPAEFNEIRPYTPEELPQIYEELIADPAFRTVVESVMPGVPFEGLAMKMRQCKTNLEFQKAFFYGLLWDLVKKTANGLTFDCSALSDLTRNYTFISNHRDIILDSAFLSILLIDNGMTTVEIAIGDNLLIYPWIHKLVRVNKSFIVKRGLNMRQKLEASALMSRYMHFAMKEKHENLWIAQRQGRAKDSNDRTQDSVLKMMAMAGEGDVTERLKELNIVPLAISYEYDPCDFLKAKELHEYIYSGWDDALGGGIYWCEQKKNGKNTCSNAPGSVYASKLFLATGDSSYLQAGIRLYEWTKENLQDPADGLYFDNKSLNGEIGRAKFAYNSGQMMQSAALLYRITGEKKYLQEAQRLAAACYNRFFSHDSQSGRKYKVLNRGDIWFTAIMLSLIHI